jgi:hypothetical protein
MGGVDIELLVVPDCPNEIPTARLVRDVLDDLGLTSTTVRTILIRTPHDARLRGFIGSPTVLINGIDPFAEPGREPALACRVYSTQSGISGVPSPYAVRQAITAANQGPTQTGAGAVRAGAASGAGRQCRRRASG